jgi:NAD(P)-dependent dehydrogenase (short-subunit alcohol dehydrogenase family)
MPVHKNNTHDQSDRKTTSLTLKGQVALITGAAGGIGRSISIVFARSGADIVLMDVNKPGLEEVKSEIHDTGQNASILVCDISKVDEIRKAANRCLKDFECIDILVNNAGVGQCTPATRISEKEWDMITEVNMKGLFFLSQEVGKEMIRKKRGNIINISSQGGVVALENQTAYCASKAGVIGITKSLAVEWAKYGIRVNAIAPTVINTPLARMAWSGKKGERMLRKIPLGKFGAPEDVASVALFLASPASEMITGATIMVDGGYTAQ